jgi:general secretion pathway protein F
MPAFAYHALAESGAAARGLIDAATPRHARQLLRARGLYPTRIDTGTGSRTTSRRPATDPATLALATRQLATLLTAGVPLTEALEALADIDRGTGWDAIWTTVRAAVREGSPLATALEAHPGVFPPTYAAVVQAGERSGTLPAGLGRLATQLDANAATRAAVRSALTYPGIMLVVTAAMLGGLLVWVVPPLTQLLRDTHATLPLATRLLLALTTAAQRTGWVVVPLTLAGAIGLRSWAATATGRAQVDAALLRLPAIGPVVRAGATARVARTLSVLAASAVPIDAALAQAATAAGNEPIRRAIAGAGADLARGQTLAAALDHTRVFPPIVIRLAATGERGGTLAAALDRAADTLEADAAQRVRTLTGLLEPALVLIMGAVVLALVSAILLPLMTLSAGVDP